MRTDLKNGAAGIPELPGEAGRVPQEQAAACFVAAVGGGWAALSAAERAFSCAGKAPRAGWACAGAPAAVWC